MQGAEKRKQLVESAIISAIAVILVLIGYYIPIFFIMTILSSVPVIMISIRHGFGWGFWSTIVISLIAGMFIHPIYGLSYFGVLWLPAAVMGYRMKKSDNSFDPIFFGGVTTLIAIVIMVFVVASIGKQDAMSLLVENLKIAMNEALKNIDNPAIKPKEVINMVTLIIPSMLINYSIMCSFFTYYIALAVLKRFKEYKDTLPSLMEFTLPGNISLGMLIMIGLTYMSSNFEFVYYKSLTENMTMVMFILLFLQGFASLSFFFTKMRISNGIRRFLLLMGFLFLSQIIVIIGFIDALFNLRRLER